MGQSPAVRVGPADRRERVATFYSGPSNPFYPEISMYPCTFGNIGDAPRISPGILLKIRIAFYLVIPGDARMMLPGDNSAHESIT